MIQAKQSIIGISSVEIEEFLGSIGEPKYRAAQIIDWIYNHKVIDPSLMSNLPNSLRSELIEHYESNLPEIVTKLKSNDESSKLALRLFDGEIIESVIMPYEGRTSLCISTQVGCPLGCAFCKTGELGFKRNLSYSEILSQYLLANELMKPESKRISHVVFMGMGEPLLNLENSIKAANTLISEDRYNLSNRNVTISTAGVVPGIKKLAELSKVRLAVSLGSAIDEVRTELMPINKKYPLSELKTVLKYYQKKTNQIITFEYILIDGLTSRISDAKQLVRFLDGLKAKVNLIPINPSTSKDHSEPDSKTIRDFQEYLSKRSYPAPVRYSRGRDISGACGQLAGR